MKNKLAKHRFIRCAVANPSTNTKGQNKPEKVGVSMQFNAVTGRTGAEGIFLLGIHPHPTVLGIGLVVKQIQSQSLDIHEFTQ